MSRGKKAILISIKPEWVEKILNGEKTIEICKSMPKCELPVDVYIYCCKSQKGSLNYFGGDKYDTRDYYFMHYDNDNWTVGLGEEFNNLCGKVVAKFTLNKGEEIVYNKLPNRVGYYHIFSCDSDLRLEKCSCLDEFDLLAYLNPKKEKGCVCGYAWYIDNLQIFDKPMKLNQFEKYYDEPNDKKPCCCGKTCKYESYDWCEHQTICSIDYDGANCPFLKVTRPPQSWQYVFVEDEDEKTN